MVKNSLTSLFQQKMRILNGRTLGDFLGKFKYIGYNGVSTVEYVLASENVLMKSHIHAFAVEDLTGDHRLLSVQLKYMKNKEERGRNPKLLPKSTRFQKYISRSTRANWKNEMNLNTISIIMERLEKCNNSEELDLLTQPNANLDINAANRVNSKAFPNTLSPIWQK